MNPQAGQLFSQTHSSSMATEEIVIRGCVALCNVTTRISTAIDPYTRILRHDYLAELWARSIVSLLIAVDRFLTDIKYVVDDIFKEFVKQAVITPCSNCCIASIRLTGGQCHGFRCIEAS